MAHKSCRKVHVGPVLHSDEFEGNMVIDYSRAEPFLAYTYIFTHSIRSDRDRLFCPSSKRICTCLSTIISICMPTVLLKMKQTVYPDMI